VKNQENGSPFLYFSLVKGPVAQWSEQGTHKLKTGVFVVLHRFANRPQTLMGTCFAGDWRLRGFSPFFAKIARDRRKRP
jgi:hypothetical protein